MASDAKEFLGIEIGGTKLQVVVGQPGCISERKKFVVNAGAGGEGIRSQISSVLPELMSKYAPAAIGVGFGGPVDWVTGRICCSHQITGWSDFSLAEWLTAESGLPTQVDNDANVAAWAESLHGAGAGFNPVFYVTLGSGVGGGLVVDGKIFHGATRGEAEIGHVRIDRNGTNLESLCSGWAVDQRIRGARANRPESILFKLIGSETKGESRHLAAAWARHDALAKEILQETAQNLAFAFSHVVHLLHPQIIVLGGGLSLIGEPLRVAVAEALPPNLMKAFQPGPRIELASLKEDAVPIGALLLAAQAHAQPKRSASPRKAKATLVKI